MKQTRYVQFAAFAATVAAYIAIRFWNLTTSCLWFDEIFSVHAAEHPWNEILSFVALDLIHPPLFYFLLKLWIGVGGESLFWLRLLPVMFSIIAIVPFIALCRELKSNFWTQALALFLLAVNGSLIKYAQEVRMYSLLLCLSLFSMWLFARYFNRGKNFTALVVVNILLVYAHYFGWFVIASEVIAIVIFQRIKWRRIVTMFAIVLVSFLPWIIAVWQAARSGSELGQNIGWMSRPSVREVAIFVFNVVEPIYYQSSTDEPVSRFIVSVPFLLVIVLTASIFLFSWRAIDGERREKLWFLLVFIQLPVITAFALSWALPYSVWGIRHLIIVLAPFWIYVAAILNEIRTRIFAYVLVGSLVGLSILGLIERAVQPRFDNPWCAWESLVRTIPADDHANIYVFEDLSAYHAWFVTRDLGASVIKVTDGKGGDPAFFLPRGFDEVKSVRLEAIRDQRFWILFREGHHDPQNEADAFRAKGFRVTPKESFGSKFWTTELSLVEMP